VQIGLSLNSLAGRLKGEDLRHFIIGFSVHSRSDVVAGFFFFSIQVV
jgi:hypothetical protein